jgi:short-chain fatty acids transporter
VIARLGSTLSRWSARLVPDPFVLALALTFVVLAVGVGRLVATGTPEGDGPLWTVLAGWADGFSDTGGLAFALQMGLVLVTGHAMAMSPPVQRAIRAVAGVPKTAAAATAIVAVVACAAALIHWGLGAIAGALLAREIGRHAASRGVALHYPLMGAAAYAGMAVWHGGLSGSAPLVVAEGASAELIGTIPLSETLLSPLNLVVMPVMVALIATLFFLLTPRREAELVPPDPASFPALPERARRPIDGAVAWLQESAAPGVLVGAAGLFTVLSLVASDRIGFDIHSVNMVFLFTGLILQGSLRHYVEAVAEGARGAGAIILQFPLYFGILGVMKASGMIDWISSGLVALSSPATFPVVAFGSAGFVNLLVPSGGGQWAVQGEILLSAGADLGVDPRTTIMAFAYGDAWTNTLQPFWALPLLGIMGLRARDIIGYTATLFLAMAVVVPVLLLLLT